MSRFAKKDRLLPVVTLVLYCGEKPWDGARSLHGMLELDGVPEELKEYVEDYRCIFWTSAIRRTSVSGNFRRRSAFC